VGFSIAVSPSKSSEGDAGRTDGFAEFTEELTPTLAGDHVIGPVPRLAETGVFMILADDCEIWPRVLEVAAAPSA
jgi:hypothetical protein